MLFCVLLLCHIFLCFIIISYYFVFYYYIMLFCILLYIILYFIVSYYFVFYYYILFCISLLGDLGSLFSWGPIDGMDPSGNGPQFGYLDKSLFELSAMNIKKYMKHFLCSNLSPHHYLIKTLRPVPLYCLF